MTITTDTTLLHDPRRQAALLYWQGFSVPQIAEMLQTKRPTVQSWKQRDEWDLTAPINRVETLGGPAYPALCKAGINRA
jgi:uncharacterized protein YjcR